SPAPRITVTAIASSTSARSSAANSSPRNSFDSGLRLSGRFSVMRCTLGRGVSTMILRYSTSPPLFRAQTRLLEREVVRRERLERTHCLRGVGSRERRDDVRVNPAGCVFLDARATLVFVT